MSSILAPLASWEGLAMPNSPWALQGQLGVPRAVVTGRGNGHGKGAVGSGQGSWAWQGRLGVARAVMVRAVGRGVCSKPVPWHPNQQVVPITLSVSKQCNTTACPSLVRLPVAASQPAE